MSATFNRSDSAATGTGSYRGAPLLRVSLIVLNYQGAELIGPCLESLVRDLGAHDEIIVVDNGSTDSSLDTIRTFNSVRLVELSENTYIFGLNSGLAEARGEYVAFLNNDIV